MAGAILSGDVTVAPRVKLAVESQVDFSDLLRRYPKGADVLEYVRNTPI